MVEYRHVLEQTNATTVGELVLEATLDLQG